MITIRIGESWESFLVRAGMPEEYAPPLSSGKPSVKSFWKVVPTDLLELPERDKQIIELVWQSMLQSSSDILSETMFTEQSMYLTEAPLVRPKRWVKFPFAKTYLLGSEFHEVVIHSPTGALRREPLGPSRLGIQLRKSADFTRASLPTRSPCSCDVHLRFSADVDLQQLTGLPEFQVGFYSGDGAFQLRSGVFLTVKKSSAGWDIGFVSQTMVGRDPVATALPPVTILGTLPPEWGGDITIEWEPTRRTFRYTVGSLQGRFPVPGRFWVEEMGFTSSAGITLETNNVGQPTYLVVSRLESLDTSLPQGIKYIPTLQTRASGDGITLYSGQDYEVNHHREGSVLTFQPAVEIPDYGWAENVGERSYTLRDNFAELLDLRASALRAENSPDLRNLLVGLLYGLLHGPHTESLHTAISALTGAPISLGKGTVVSLYDRQGNPAVIVDEGSRERVYPFRHTDRLVVGVGDRVDFMQVLTDVSPLLTWVDGQPFLRAVKHTLGSEVEKYKVLLIEYPAEIIDRFLDKEEVEQLTRDYLSRALPLWVSAANIIFVYLVVLEDRLNLQDEFLIPDETVDLYGSLNRLQDPFIYASPAEPRYGLVPERRYGDFYGREDGAPFEHDAVSLRDELEIEDVVPSFDPLTHGPGVAYDFTDPTKMATGPGGTGGAPLDGEEVQSIQDLVSGEWVDFEPGGASYDKYPTYSATGALYLYSGNDINIVNAPEVPGRPVFVGASSYDLGGVSHLTIRAGHSSPSNGYIRYMLNNTSGTFGLGATVRSSTNNQEYLSPTVQTPITGDGSSTVLLGVDAAPLADNQMVIWRTEEGDVKAPLQAQLADPVVGPNGWFLSIEVYSGGAGPVRAVRRAYATTATLTAGDVSPLIAWLEG